MEDATGKSILEEVAALLHSHGVEFIIIGGQAETLHGSSRVTYDTDLCYRRSEDNFVKLALALKKIKPTLRGAPEDLPFKMDAKTIGLGSNFTLSTSFGALDLLGDVEPLGGYEQLRDHAERMQLGELNVQVIALDDLIKVKQHINRPKDRESLMHLLAIKRMRDETGLH